MAESKNSFLDSLIGTADRLGNIYSKVEYARQGVPVPPATVSYETRGANDPVVMQGSPGSVSVRDPLAEAIDNATTKVAAVGLAHETRKMMPMIVGGMALAITIYLLTKK